MDQNSPITHRSTQDDVDGDLYFPTLEDGLTLNEGDQIEVIQTLGGGWKRGRIKGRIVTFWTSCHSNGHDTSDAPSSASVKQMEEKKRSSSAYRNGTIIENWMDVDEESKLISRKSRPPTQKPASNGTVPVAERSSSPLRTTLGETDLKDGTVNKNSSLCSHHQAPIPPTRKPRPPPKPEALKAKEKAKVIHSYVAEYRDELDLPEEGAIVTVTNKNHCPGWFEGELNGKRGLFPSAYVELIQAHHKDPRTLPLNQKSVDPKKPAEPGCPSSQQSDNFKTAHKIIAEQLNITAPGAEPPKSVAVERIQDKGPVASPVREGPKKTNNTHGSPDLKTALKSLKSFSKEEVTQLVPEGEPPAHQKKASAKVLPKNTPPSRVLTAFVLKPVSSSAESEYVTQERYNELLIRVEELANRIAILEQNI
uniref:SH3 domain-containing protein n=1 Tax=Steinernema glaseri TaxID=37863 RepID=A0A1I7Y6P1_9BILA